MLGVGSDGVELLGLGCDWAELRGAGSDDVELGGAGCGGVGFRGTCSDGVELGGADPGGVGLRGVVLGGVKLRGARSRGVELRGICSDGVKFSGVLFRSCVVGCSKPDCPKPDSGWSDLRFPADSSGDRSRSSKPMSSELDLISCCSNTTSGLPVPVDGSCSGIGAGSLPKVLSIQTFTAGNFDKIISTNVRFR